MAHHTFDLPVEPGLDWAAPEGCPSREDVVARTEQYLGAPFDAPRAERFAATPWPIVDGALCSG